MLTYKPENLKEQFPELERLEDLTIIPMFEIAFYRWLNQIPQEGIVTDIVKERSDSFSPRTTYNCVVDGKIVKINSLDFDIDVCDEDEMIYMVGEISFDGNDKATKKLLNSFRVFVGKQNLSDLVKDSANKLKKEKTYHLTHEMCDFYLDRAFTQAGFRHKD